MLFHDSSLLSICYGGIWCDARDDCIVLVTSCRFGSAAQTSQFAMMNCLCHNCGVQRPVQLKFWMPSQIKSIMQSGSPATSSFNCCRLCSPECWVEVPLPKGALAANLCIICREIRPGHRQYWMPSQVKSIWYLGSSVTSEYNCCRLCNPDCWTPIVGPRATCLLGSHIPRNLRHGVLL